MLRRSYGIITNSLQEIGDLVAIDCGKCIKHYVTYDIREFKKLPDTAYDP